MVRRSSCLLKVLNSSAPKLVARTELQLPLVLVLLAPLKLACRKGLAAEDDLVARMLILCASNTLNLALGHNATAAEALLGGHALRKRRASKMKARMIQINEVLAVRPIREDWELPTN